MNKTEEIELLGIVKTILEDNFNALNKKIKENEIELFKMKLQRTRDKSNLELLYDRILELDNGR